MPNTKRRDVGRVILKVVGVAGILGLAVLAPNVIGAINQIGLIKSKKREKEILDRSCKRLISRGLLSMDSKGNIKLTKRGLDEYRKIEISEYKINKPKHGWDGKWRVVIFDIPEKRRRTRDMVRDILIKSGFKKLQSSVWVHPYECRELITLMKTDMFLGKNIIYITADEIENSAHLRKYFNLG